MLIRRHESRNRDRLGFTLMEVLVAVAILVVLASVSAVAVLSYLENAKKDRAKSDLQTLTDACKSFKMRNDYFPSTLQELLAPPNGERPYLETADSIIDPWGNPYQYDPNGAQNAGLRPDIWCVDEDGNEIGNWMSARAGR